MDNQAATKLVAHKAKIFSRLEAALRVGALDNRGVLTSPRRAPEVAQQLGGLWFEMLAGLANPEKVAQLAVELVEKGLSYNCAAGAMKALQQGILEVTLAEDPLRLTLLLALDTFADTFLREVAVSREHSIIREQENYQASLQRALQNELSGARRLSERLGRRQHQMRAVITIYSAISNLADEAEILRYFAALAHSHLDLAGVAVFELAANKQSVAVRASAGNLPETLKSETAQPTGLLKQAISQNQQVISERTDEGRSAYEVFIPLRVGEGTLGILGLWLMATELSEDVLEFIQPLAIVLTTTWQNVRLLAHAEERTRELEALQGQRVQKMWASGAPRDSHGYVYDGVRVVEGEIGNITPANLTLPIAIREWPVGQLNLPDLAGQNWSKNDLTFVEAVIREMANALENARLIQDTQGRARREQTIRQITEKMRTAISLQELAKTTARELGQHLAAGHAVVELGIESETHNLTSFPNQSNNIGVTQLSRKTHAE